MGVVESRGCGKEDESETRPRHSQHGGLVLVSGAVRLPAGHGDLLFFSCSDRRGPLGIRTLPVSAGGLPWIVKRRNAPKIQNLFVFLVALQVKGSIPIFSLL